MSVATAGSQPIKSREQQTAFGILIAISVSHMLNDVIQSLIPAIYPLLKDGFKLDFGQIGLITLAFQLTASILQPVVGIVTDKHPQPFSLAVGMGSTLAGLLMLSGAASYPMLLVSVALIGLGSSIFHPESSRVARMASGGRHGFAQSLFQVGGNVGSAIGPLLAAFIVVPHGQASLSWFSVVALAGIVILTRVGFWYAGRRRANAGKPRAVVESPLPRALVISSLVVLVALVFSKFLYMASFSSYYTFYLIDTFHVPVQQAQIYLFVYLGATALGTFVGGPIGDRFGRKFVIWMSILGVLPFSLMLPFANLFWTVVLTVPIGMILASAFPAIIVYGTELLPGKVGMISGLFFGLAFGMGGLGAAILGVVADHTSIGFVYAACSVLPAIGLLTVFLPNLHERHVR